jgi:hypothetical protein
MGQTLVCCHLPSPFSPPPPPPPHYTKKPEPIDPEKAAQVRNFFTHKASFNRNLPPSGDESTEKTRSKSKSKISTKSPSLRGAGSRVDDINTQRDSAQRALERKRSQVRPEPKQLEISPLSSVIQDITPSVITPSSPTHYSFPLFLFDQQSLSPSAPPASSVLPTAPPPENVSISDDASASFLPAPLSLPESSVFAPPGWSPSRLKPETDFTEPVYDGSSSGANARRRAAEAEVLAENSRREEREAKREALVLRLELMEAQAALDKVKKESVHSTEATLCIVCIDNSKNIAFVPCGHSVCTSCDESLQARNKGAVCPLCRGEISSRLKLY